MVSFYFCFLVRCKLNSTSLLYTLATMSVIFCAWPSFIIIKYNCTLAKLTLYKIHILFTYCSHICYFFFPLGLVHESATIQDLFRSFISHCVVIKWLHKATLSGLRIIPRLNKDRNCSHFIFEELFHVIFLASTVSLVKNEAGFRLIYFSSFITTVLHRLSIASIFDLDLIFAACRKVSSKPFWIDYLISSMLSRLIKLLLLFRRKLTLIHQQLHQKVNVCITSHKGSTSLCNGVLSLPFSSLRVVKKIAKTNLSFWLLHRELQHMNPLMP